MIEVPLIKWKDEYSVGHSVMDEQHRKIISLIQQLNAMVKEHPTQAEIKAVLDQLRDYSFRHIREEEIILKTIKSKTLDVNGHIIYHNKYRQRVAEFMIDYMDGCLSAESILVFLNDWWKHHILIEDAKYGTILKK